MEKISNFKTFSKISADNTAVKIGEENEVKRGEIAEKVKAVLSDLDISSLDDLTEDQKDEFINNLFASETIDDDDRDADGPRNVDDDDDDDDDGDDDDGDDDDGDDDDDDDEISEGEIKSDSQFRKYAKKLLQKAFGDDFDLDKAEKTINGLIKKYDEYGAMIGAIKSALSK